MDLLTIILEQKDHLLDSLFSVSSEFVPKKAFDQIFEHSSQPREARLDVGARRWIHVIDHLLQG